MEAVSSLEAAAMNLSGARWRSSTCQSRRLTFSRSETIADQRLDIAGRDRPWRYRGAERSATDQKAMVPAMSRRMQAAE